MVIKGVRKRKHAPKVQPVTKVAAEPEIKNEENFIPQEDVTVEEAPKKEPRRKRPRRDFDTVEISAEPEVSIEEENI